MICKTCGGTVEWKGPWSALTHTECLYCGAINNHEPDDLDPHDDSPACDEDELETEGHSDNAWCLDPDMGAQ